MEAIIFCGLQASGKSSFYKENFFTTHMRINLDMLKNRRREALILEACLNGGQRFVVDNTNPTIEDRARYIEAAKEHHFSITGYYFNSTLEDCLERNKQRKGKACIPDKGVIATYKKFQPPIMEEGFKELFEVTLTTTGFEIKSL